MITESSQRRHFSLWEFTVGLVALCVVGFVIGRAFGEVVGRFKKANLSQREVIVRDATQKATYSHFSNPVLEVYQNSSLRIFVKSSEFESVSYPLREAAFQPIVHLWCRGAKAPGWLGSYVAFYDNRNGKHIVTYDCPWDATDKKR